MALTNDSSLKKELGHRIRDVRINNHMTQAQFAESIDISVNFLSEIENGKKGISCETLYVLCNHHNISADYLLFGEPSPDLVKHSVIEIINKLPDEDLTVLDNYIKALQNIRNM